MLCAQGHSHNSANQPVYLSMQPLTKSTTKTSRKSSSTGAMTDQTRKYSTSTTFNITVLISGSGTNLQALIDACNGPSGALMGHARITHVISNRKSAYGLKRAEEAHIPTLYHNLVSYKQKESQDETGVQKAREHYDADLAQRILTHIPSPDLVVCAGWMHILSDPFINALKSANVPIINLHPALPGKFNGANAIDRAWEAYQRGEIAGTGVMIHHVIGEVDMGEPIVVKEVACVKGEKLSDLEERIHKTEWEVIVEGVSKELAVLEEARKVGSL